MSEEQRLRDCLCYLASCQAATLESLPKSAPKYQRRRHTNLARIAMEFVEGQIAGRPPTPEWTVQRLADAIRNHALPTPTAGIPDTTQDGRA